MFFWVFRGKFLAGLSSGFVFLGARLYNEWFYLQLFGCQKFPFLATQSQVSLITFLEGVFGRPYVVSGIQCNFFLFWLPKLQLRFHWRTSFSRPFLKIMLTNFSKDKMFLRALSRQLSGFCAYYKAFLKIGHF